MKNEISLIEARIIALTAQGFNARDRERNVSLSQIARAIERLGLLQIDSVNVLERAHYLPLFSRLGNYDRSLLDDLMIKRPKRFFEYWGHEASLLPLDCHPLLRWRMERARKGEGVWSRMVPFASEQRSAAEALLLRIRDGGPIAASDLREGAAKKGMWVWSDGKRALEWLFWSGLIAATHRRNSFERVYDLPERVLPKSILDLPTPTSHDAQKELVSRSAKFLGIATAGDLRDYYRLPAPGFATLVHQLVEDHMLLPVNVEGWRQQAYMHRDAHRGRKTDGAALLSPFDPLVWRRERTERLFNFRYRLEIYTPAHKREHGYYVLPFLLDGALVARVDLKGDRQLGVLLVQKASLEKGAPSHTVEALVEELKLMASWLGLKFKKASLVKAFAVI